MEVAMRGVLIASLLFSLALSPVRAELRCGDPPRVDDHLVKAELKDKAEILFGHSDDAAFRERVEESRTDIFARYPRPIQARSEAYLLYMFCTLVVGDPKLSTEQKLQKVEELRQSSGNTEAQTELLMRYDQHEQELAVKDNALNNFFRIIGEKRVPAEDLDAELREIATNYVTLQQQAQNLPDSNPLKGPAIGAIDEGEYARAATLIAAAQDQVRAVRLIDQHPDQALALLQKAEAGLAAASAHPTASLRLQQGYDYKTYGQVFLTKGDQARADRYFDLALQVFEQVKDDPRLEGKTTEEIAGAINGIGNIHFYKQQYRDAIADYQLATSLEPSYAYAWLDMFGAYVALAQRGELDLVAMRRALSRLKQTGAGWPGLDAKYIAKLDATLARFEQSAGPDHHNGPNTQ
jgi:tetratricopeptide (TPR) repeat protein